MNRFRPIVAGLALALVVAACGDDGTDLAAPPTEPGLQAPAPVRVTGAGGAAPAAAESAGADGRMAEMDAAESSILPAFGGFDYEVGDGLPALPTASTGYQFPPGATVDAARVAELAAALGVEGEPVAGGGPDVDGVLWRVGPDDGSAPSLTVSADSQLGWYYAPAWLDQGAVPCEQTYDEQGQLVGEACPEPEPPTGVPTAADAEERARDLLVTLGEDPAAFEIEPYADEWFASVAASELLDGVRSPMQWGFGFGGEGRLEWASGYLAEPVATGPYPLIDLDEAIARLEDQSSMWGAIATRSAVDPMVAAESDGAVAESEPVEATIPADTAPPTAPAPTDTVPAETVPAETVPAATVPTETVPTETVPVETVPVETVPVETVPVETAPATVPAETVPVETVPPVSIPEPEPIVATLVDVRADLWWAWDEDGSVWLLPAYTFTDTEGGTHTVPAVTDEYLIVVEIPEPEPLPVEPVDPPADGSLVPAEVGVVLGLTVDEATAALEELGYSVRVVRADGVDLAATADYVETRVNVATTGGVIDEILSLG